MFAQLTGLNLIIVKEQSRPAVSTAGNFLNSNYMYIITNGLLLPGSVNIKFASFLLPHLDNEGRGGGDYGFGFSDGKSGKVIFQKQPNDECSIVRIKFYKY